VESFVDELHLQFLQERWKVLLKMMLKLCSLEKRTHKGLEELRTNCTEKFAAVNPDPLFAHIAEETWKEMCPKVRQKEVSKKIPKQS